MQPGGVAAPRFCGEVRRHGAWIRVHALFVGAHQQSKHQNQEQHTHTHSLGGVLQEGRGRKERRGLEVGKGAEGKGGRRQKKKGKGSTGIEGGG